MLGLRYKLPPVLTGFADIGELYVTPPALVTVRLFPLVSVIYVPEDATLNNNDVPDIAVKGDVGTVKLLVYTAVPFTIRKLVIYPVKVVPGELDESDPIAKGSEFDITATVIAAGVIADIPFTYRYILLLFLTNAT